MSIRRAWKAKRSRQWWPGLLVAAALAAASLSAGCAAAPPAAGSRTLLVFAAASLTNAFAELAALFEFRHPEVTVALNLAGSSQLAAQLAEGAPADLFASANPEQMAAAVAAGRVDAAAVRPFAANRLAILVPTDNPAGIVELADLARPGVLLVLAVPGVPARRYTDDILNRLDPTLAAAIYANLVSEEDNVRQVVAKIALGEADAGLVYASDATPELAGRVRAIPLPADLNVPAVYPVAVLRDAPHPALAEAFVELLLSPEGQAVLAAWGFQPP